MGIGYTIALLLFLSSHALINSPDFSPVEIVNSNPIRRSPLAIGDRNAIARVYDRYLNQAAVQPSKSCDDGRLKISLDTKTFP